MPIAAVPAYLGKDLKDASPGLRFSIYLPIWTERTDQEQDVKKRAGTKNREGAEVAEMLQRQGMDATIRQLQQRSQNPLAGLWDKNDFAAKLAWKQITILTPRDQKTVKSLLARQQTTFAAAGPEEARLSLSAQAIAPFTTGLGNEHPLENGFAFLNPYGLPYLPGSGIKGVLRQAARELAEGMWGDTQGWKEAKTFPLMQREGKDRKPVLDKNKQQVFLSMFDALFGLEPANGETQHVRGALSFWDVIPQIKGDSLAVDIMTPHQSHYYQQKQDRKAGDSTTPHDSGQPNPISFLTVPAGSGFTFHVCCDLAHLKRLAPTLAHDEHWKGLLTSAFEHAFSWLGFGAKTSVGYGVMAVDVKAQAKAEEAARERAAETLKATRLASMTENQQAIEAFITDLRTKHEQYPTFKEAPNAAFHIKARKLAKAAHEGPDWTADEKMAAADAIEEWLPKLVKVDIKDERKKLKLSVLRGN